MSYSRATEDLLGRTTSERDLYLQQRNQLMEAADTEHLTDKFVETQFRWLTMEAAQQELTQEDKGYTAALAEVIRLRAAINDIKNKDGEK